MQQFLAQFDKRIWDISYITLLMFYVLLGTALVPFHGDESTQIFMARDFYYQFVEGDISRVRYAEFESLDGDAATEQNLRMINGTVPKYLFGLAAHWAGYTIDDLNQQWLWGAGWQWNIDNGHKPSDDLLTRTRWTSALMLALSVPVLFGIGLILGGRWVAYVGSFYYALNPAVLINGRRAMMEGGMLLFSLLVVFIALMTIRKQRWWLFILLGIASGLAVASKHTSVVTVAAVFLSLAISLALKYWREELTKLGQLFIGLVGAGVLSLGVFYALNPAWWGDPVARVPEILEMRQELLEGQINTFDGYANFSEQVAGFARQVFIVKPMYAETNVDNFRDNIAASVDIYENSLWSGIPIGGNWIGAIIAFALCVIGVWQSWRVDIVIGMKVLFTLWGVAMLILTLFITPLEWQRYYLPIYPVIAIWLGFGVLFVVERLQGKTL